MTDQTNLLSILEDLVSETDSFLQKAIEEHMEINVEQIEKANSRIAQAINAWRSHINTTPNYLQDFS